MTQQPARTTRTVEVLRGLGALIVLMVLLAGTPAGLYAVAGSPLPHAVPTWNQISARLTQPDTDSALFLATVKVIAWAAWTLFTTITVIEAAHFPRGRPARRLPRPLHPLQHLARDLLASIALLVSTTASITGSTSFPLAHPTAAVASDQPRPHHAAATTPTAQRPSADHRTLVPRSMLPAHAPRPWRMHVIRRGDTLWAIARHAYGTGTKYPAIFNASKDLPQAHGLPSLTDPDRIYPGQRIKIPHANGNRAHSAHPRPPGHPHHPRPAPPSTAPPPSARGAPPAPVSPTPAPASSSPPDTSLAATPPLAPAPSPSVSAPAAAPTGAPRPTSQPGPPGPPATPKRPEPSGGTPGSHPPTTHGRHRSEPVIVTLPSGAYVGLGLAGAISLALAATRLHRRRRTHLDQWPTPTEPEPAPPPPRSVAKVRKAHLDTYTDRGEPIPSDADLVAADVTSPTPTHLTAGLRDGQDLTIPLGGLNLGLTGPGAPDAVRAIMTELLGRSRRYRVEVVIAEPDATTLLAGTGLGATELAEAIPGLILRPSLDAAIAYLQAEFLHRARLLQTLDEPDVPALRITEPGEPLPALVLITTPPANPRTLHTIVTFGSQYCVGAILLGTWTAGTTVHVSADGTVTHADGPDSNTWTQARLFHLPPADAAGMLHVIRTAHGAPEPATPAPATAPAPTAPTPTVASPPAPISGQTRQRRHDETRPNADTVAPARAPAASPLNGATSPPDADPPETPRPVQLHLLGRIRIEAAGTPLTTGIRRITRDLLAYLALHPDGITRDQGIDALLPDQDAENGSTMFHTAVNNARKALRAATGLSEPMFIIHAGGTYRLDPHLIDTDLWHLQTALDQAQDADNDTERIHALRQLPDIYTAELAEEISSEWAETARERLRRHATDALVHLAHLTQADDPDQALTALEHAITHDPYDESAYQHLMRLQAQLHRFDAVRRTYQLLTNQLSDLDTDPSDETHQLMLTLLRTPPARTPPPPPHRRPPAPPPGRKSPSGSPRAGTPGPSSHKPNRAG